MQITDANELTVDPGALARTAGAVLDTGLRLADRTVALAAALGAALPVGVVGARLRDEDEAGLAEAEAALDRLADVLHGDADKLYRTAFAAQDAQWRATGRLDRAGLDTAAPRS